MAYKRNQAFKKDRALTVYEASSGSDYKPVPQIRLQGEWLNELGFEPGEKLNVHCEAAGMA